MNSLDTLGYCKRLETVGVSREQAKVHAQILTEVMSQVATKDDLKEVETAVKELEVVTKRELQELEVRLKEWVALYVKEQIAGLKADMLKWFIAISITQASLMIAALPLSAGKPETEKEHYQALSAQSAMSIETDCHRE